MPKKKAKTVEAGTKVSLAEAKKVLQEESKKSVQHCEAEIRHVLKKYGFALSATMLVTENGVKTNVILVPAKTSQQAEQ